jgi:hypothetical protein
MPSPKRWFPVSRELNFDAEVWELTETYGDRALRVWLELLACADKTENHISLPVTWVSSLARITKTNPKTVARVVLWMLEREWLVVLGEKDEATKWVYTLRQLCQDWPQNPRRNAGEGSVNQRSTLHAWLMGGRALILGTDNYWKYHKRQEPKGADVRSLPSEPSEQTKDKNLILMSTPSELDPVNTGNGSRTVLPPADLLSVPHGKKGYRIPL